MTVPWQKRLIDAGLSFLGGVLGLGGVALLHEQLYGASGLPLLIAAFGASAVVLYGCAAAPIAQPRNLFGGSLISAFIGVCIAELLPDQPVWLNGMLAVSLSLAAMSLTGTMHPPGGAMAFIAVGGSPEIHHLGFMYMLYPVGTGIALMFIVAVLVNYFSPTRTYPLRWW